MTLQRDNQMIPSPRVAALGSVMARLEAAGWDFKLHSRQRDGVRVYTATVWQHGVVWAKQEGAATPEDALMQAWSQAKRKLRRAQEGT